MHRGLPGGNAPGACRIGRRTPTSDRSCGRLAPATTMRKPPTPHETPRKFDAVRVPTVQSRSPQTRFSHFGRHIAAKLCGDANTRSLKSRSLNAVAPAQDQKNENRRTISVQEFFGKTCSPSCACCRVGVVGGCNRRPTRHGWYVRYGRHVGDVGHGGHVTRPRPCTRT